MVANKQNIIVTTDSSIYFDDNRVKWIYENLYGQYKNFEVVVENNKIIVYGNVMIPHEYESIPIKIDEVYGNVIIDNYNSNNAHGNLKTLKNFPTIIHGDFKCRLNKDLTSLEGGPTQVDGDFICVGCGLTSIKHMPKKIGNNFYVYSNHINDVTPLFESVIGGSADLEYNPCENVILHKHLNKYIDS